MSTYLGNLSAELYGLQGTARTRKHDRIVQCLFDKTWNLTSTGLNVSRTTAELHAGKRVKRKRKKPNEEKHSGFWCFYTFEGYRKLVKKRKISCFCFLGRQSAKRSGHFSSLGTSQSISWTKILIWLPRPHPSVNHIWSRPRRDSERGN